MIDLLFWVFYLFLFPGIGYSFLLFKEHKIIEKIAIAVFISISINTILAFILGANLGLKNLTGGYSFFNIFLLNLVIGLIGMISCLVSKK